MYDVKAFDIKNTIVSFSKTLQNLKVSFATVHLLNGEETLKEAVKHSGNVKLIGVSVLTSFSEQRDSVIFHTKRVTFDTDTFSVSTA